MFEFVLLLVFGISVAGILYTYVGYPILLAFVAQFYKLPKTDEITDFPNLTIVLAAYNEQLFIEKKIRNIFETDYPINKIELLIGSDASTDNTNAIIQKLCLEFPQIQLIEFSQRTGKPDIINHLVQIASNELIIFTDAKALFETSTIKLLVSRMNQKIVGLVSARLINQNVKSNGISVQEKTYFSLESKIKEFESRIWGCMIGAFGACYILRKKDYVPTPPKIIADDFFISMKVLENNKKAILDSEIICYQNVSNEIDREFKRKTRISMGNFQNLILFWKIFFKAKMSVSFCFFSHKIVRWMTPFLLILAICSNAFLLHFHDAFKLTLIAQFGLVLIPLLDFLLQKINLHFKPFRFITHFYSMNLALLWGFIKYTQGIHSNIWEPTKRSD